jgi:hypothetical protein
VSTPQVASVEGSRSLHAFAVNVFSYLLARASTYSFYKSWPTVKFLIAITPQSTISYILQGYGGTQVMFSLRKTASILQLQKIKIFLQNGYLTMKCLPTEDF